MRRERRVFTQKPDLIVNNAETTDIFKYQSQNFNPFTTFLDYFSQCEIVGKISEVKERALRTKKQNISHKSYRGRRQDKLQGSRGREQ